MSDQLKKNNNNALLIIAVCIALLSIGGCSKKMFSVQDAYARLESDAAEILETEKYGTVEYKITGGGGIPVLSIHGISGGYDQGLMTAKSLLPEDRKIIAISRLSGYAVRY